MNALCIFGQAGLVIGLVALAILLLSCVAMRPDLARGARPTAVVWLIMLALLATSVGGCAAFAARDELCRTAPASGSASADDG